MQSLLVIREAGKTGPQDYFRYSATRSGNHEIISIHCAYAEDAPWNKRQKQIITVYSCHLGVDSLSMDF